MKLSVRVWIALLAGGAAVVVPLAGTSGYLNSLLVLSCVYALLGLSTNLMFGYLGYTTFGQAAFLGLGAYTAALLSQHAGLSYWAAAAVAIVPGAGLGVLMAFASLRVGGAYFAICTMTVAEVLRLLADNWIDLTHGPMGLILQRPTVDWLSDLGLSFAEYYLLIVICATGGAFWLVATLLQGPVGRAWRAYKESPNLAESVGIPTLRYRMANIALAGAIGSLAGALLLPKILVASPDLFGSAYSAIAMLIVVLGGMGTLVGPLIGGFAFALLPEMLRFIDEYRMAIFAFLLLLLVRVRPEGVAGFLPHGWRELPLVMRLARTASTRSAIKPASLSADPPTRVDTENPILQVSGVGKRFGGLVAVDGVSFDVHVGEIVGLMGPNGAGKTTCLNLMSGFLVPSDGTVLLGGKSLHGVSPHEVASLGMVRTFQHTTLFPTLSARDNVLAATHLRTSSTAVQLVAQASVFQRQEAVRVAVAENALRRVGLQDRADVVAGSMAYGEQRLLAIALALAAEPRLLLLDEPAAGMNPSEAAHLARVIRELRTEGVTIVLVEHNVPLMMSLCDRLVVLHHGAKIAEGEPGCVRNNEQVVQAYFGTAMHEEPHHAAC